MSRVMTRDRTALTEEAVSELILRDCMSTFSNGRSTNFRFRRIDASSVIATGDNFVANALEFLIYLKLGTHYFTWK